MNHAARSQRQEGPGRGTRGPGARYLPGQAAAAVPRGFRAQHNLLSFPGGDSAVPKTVLLAFATIPTEIQASLESWGGGSGGPARRARRLWPCGPAAPWMPTPALAGEARAASSPPSPCRCPLPSAPPRSPGRARVGAADRLRNPGRKLLAFSAAPPGGAEATPDPCLLFWVKHWGLGLQCSRSLDEDEDGKYPPRWVERGL